MIYLNTQTQEYPRHDGDLELLGWVVGQPLPENWVEVVYTEAPTVAEGQTPVQLFPVEVDGVWTITWLVRDLTDEEKINIAAREQAELDRIAALTNPPVLPTE